MVGMGPRMCARLALSALAALLCAQLGAGKTVYGKGYFGTNKITEVTKFSFRPGSSRIEGNITFQGEPRGSLYLFMDTNWQEKFYAEEDCAKVKHAHTKIKIGKQGNAGTGIGGATGYQVEDIPDSRNKRRWMFSWKVTHAVRTYGWYVVIADCAGHENGDEVEGGVPPTNRRRYKKNQFEYNIELYNPGDDHLPADERGLPTLYWIVFALMSGYFYTSSTAYKKRTGNGLIFDSHAVVKAFAFAYVFQILSMLLEILHLWVYSSNGRGVFMFDFFSEFFDSVSQLIISFTLLCLGNGWTLGIDFSRRPGGSPSLLKQFLNKPSLDDEQPTLFILIILVFVSTILQIINKVQDDDFLKFHDYDGLSGKFLLLQRVVLGAAFFSSIRGTIGADEVRGQVQLEGFLRQLMVLGTLWFFALPLILIIAAIFAHYLRHIVVTSGVLIVQSVCLTFMAQQLFANTSRYAKVSEISYSGMLPGFGGGGSSKGGKIY